MSTIGSVTSGAIHALMMKPPPGPPSGALPNGVQGKRDGDGDTDTSASAADSGSVSRLLDLSV